MTKTVRLALTDPVALAGGPKEMWVADRAAHILARFDEDGSHEVARIPLPESPVSLTTAEGVVAAGLRSGVAIAFDRSTGKEVWRRAVGVAEARLKGYGDRVWASDKDGDVVTSFDSSGEGRRFASEGMVHFAGGPDGFYWVSRENVLIAQSASKQEFRTMRIPDGVTVGALAFCANALWASVTKALLLVDINSLEVRTSLDAPEGPVSNLICHDGKLAGGLNGVFVMDPRSDVRLQTLDVKPDSSIRALAATDQKIWVLESAAPVVHIADFN